MGKRNKEQEEQASQTDSDTIHVPTTPSRKRKASGPEDGEQVEANGSTTTSLGRRQSVKRQKQDVRVRTPSKKAQDGLATTPRRRPAANSGNGKATGQKSTRPPRAESPTTSSSSEDSEGHHELDPEVSRRRFLDNERSKVAKQARNFEYTGSANASRRLRSGKIVQEEPAVTIADDPDREASDSQDGGIQLDENTMEDDLDYLLPDNIVSASTPLNVSDFHQNAQETRSQSLPPEGKLFLNRILSAYSSPCTTALTRTVADELATDSALSHLVNLLGGTVERGEGNSCLVMGSTGSGKTRVGSIHLDEDSIAMLIRHQLL